MPCSAARAKVYCPRLLPVQQVQGDDRQQHEQAAGDGVDEELDRGVDAPPVPAVHPDEEEHRDDHDLPEKIEEKEIESEKDPHDPRLHEQNGGEEKGKLVLAAPGNDDGDGLGEGGEQDHQQGNAVHAQGVMDAEALDPGIILVQQPAAAACQGDVIPHGQGQHQQSRQQGDPAAEGRMPAQAEADHAAGGGQADQQGQQGEG